MGPDPSGSIEPKNDEDPSPRGVFARIFKSKAEPCREQPAQATTPAALHRIRLEDVAVPRADIEAVATNAPIKEVVSTFKTSGYSRLPVFNDNLDNPVGFLHLKDVALKFGFNGVKATSAGLKKLLRPLIFAPPSMPVSVLLQRMQKDRMHMALIIDEYGGVDGLVTIEDLIELVVGEIEDEHDVDQGEDWVETSPGVYMVKARAPLSDFETALGASLSQNETSEEVETIGGLVFMLTGRVPSRGEIISHLGYDLVIAEADTRRIKRILVRPSAKKD